MKTISELVHAIIRMREAGKRMMSLLAVCPNSKAVLEAAVNAAAKNRSPMLFAATLNQVDRDGGYTGWTQTQFVAELRSYAAQIGWDGPLYPCLDHGGPWLKDLHRLEELTFEETMNEVKQSITACLEAGYQLLHIDPTVDRDLPENEPVPVETVIARTIELISYAEAERERLGLPPIAYEVGTEEVHGGLADLKRLHQFLQELRDGLDVCNMADVWPCFVVAQVGTDLHTTTFDPQIARSLYKTVAPLGSLAKGHYTDWVDNPYDYPRTGMGGANVGPEFTAEEYLALRDLCDNEETLCRNRIGLSSSNLMNVLEQVVVDSGRWMKWRVPEEDGLDFFELSPERRAWLTQTSVRYIWTHPKVVASRSHLYDNLAQEMSDPHEYVVNRIEIAIDKYIKAFNLYDSLTIFD